MLHLKVLIALLGFLFVATNAAPIHHQESSKVLSETSNELLTSVASCAFAVYSVAIIDLITNGLPKSANFLADSLSAIRSCTLSPSANFATLSAISSSKIAIDTMAPSAYFKRAESGLQDSTAQLNSVRGGLVAGVVVGVFIALALLVCLCGKLAVRLTNQPDGINASRRRCTNGFCLGFADSWTRFEENVHINFISTRLFLRRRLALDPEPAAAPTFGQASTPGLPEEDSDIQLADRNRPAATQQLNFDHATRHNQNRRSVPWNPAMLGYPPFQPASPLFPSPVLGRQSLRSPRPTVRDDITSTGMHSLAHSTTDEDDSANNEPHNSLRERYSRGRTGLHPPPSAHLGPSGTSHDHLLRREESFYTQATVGLHGSNHGGRLGRGGGGADISKLGARRRSDSAKSSDSWESAEGSSTVPERWSTLARRH